MSKPKWVNPSYGVWLLEADDGRVLDTVSRTWLTFTVASTRAEYTSLEAAKKAAEKLALDARPGEKG